MAVDEALLRCFDSACSSPIIRLYGWNPPSFSLGRFQKVDEVLDLELCRADGIPIVRRVSGGGAIYHADELTYSLVCSPNQVAQAASVKDSFRILTGFLISYYRSLGLEASYAVDVVTDQGALGRRTAYCFAGKETFDIMIQGKKIGGNAQRRQKNVIFQHGSIPIVNRSEQGFGYMLNRASESARNTGSLEDFGVEMDIERLKKQLMDSFIQNLETEMVVSQLTEAELYQADSLLGGKYADDGWNLYGDVT